MSVGAVNICKVSFLQRLNSYILEKAHSPKAMWILMLISFTESSVFILPPDLLMIPMGIVNKSKVWSMALWLTVSSVLGGIVGYFLGAFLLDFLGKWLIEVYQFQDSMQSFYDYYQKWGFWIIVLKGVTPIPYKLVALASGIAHYPLMMFILASVVCRAVRFYALAAVLYYFGDKAKKIFDKFMVHLFLISILIIVAGFYIVKKINF